MILRAARNWGWVFGPLGFLVAILVLVGADQANAPVPLPGDTTKIVPATGIGGLDVEPFCTDAATTVGFSIVPDGGYSHELVRIKDGVTETVTVSFAQDGSVAPAKHYFDSTAGPASQPAVVNQKAVDCIEAKRVLKR